MVNFQKNGKKKIHIIIIFFNKGERREKKMKNCKISAKYFQEGDYTHWYSEYLEENPNSGISYEEYIRDILIPEMEEYDYLLLFEDGTLYGVKGGISHDISFNEFEPYDTEIFENLCKEFGVDKTEE